MMQIGWVVLVAFGISAAQALWYKYPGLRGLGYDRRFDRQTAFVGERVELIETVTNRSPWPVSWVRLEAEFDSGLQFFGNAEMITSQGRSFQYHKSAFSLPSRTRWTRRHAITCRARGYHRLYPVALTAGDLLGLVRLTREWRPQSELYIYPQILSLAELPDPANRLLGEISLRRVLLEDPFLTVGARDYQPGDPLRMVHWGATARTGRLMVRRLEYTADRELMICLNFECSEDMWEAVLDPGLIESGISYAASVAALAVERGNQVGFAANARLGGEGDVARAAPGAGDGQLDHLLRMMARLTMRVDGSFQALLAREADLAMTGCDILILSAFISDAMRERLASLESLGHTVHFWPLVSDPAASGGAS